MGSSGMVMAVLAGNRCRVAAWPPENGLAGEPLQPSCPPVDLGNLGIIAARRTWTMGRRAPSSVCSSVLMPEAKKHVQMTFAASSVVPPIWGTMSSGISTVAPSMVRKVWKPWKQAAEAGWRDGGGGTEGALRQRNRGRRGLTWAVCIRECNADTPALPAVCTGTRGGRQICHTGLQKAGSTVLVPRARWRRQWRQQCPTAGRRQAPLFDAGMLHTARPHLENRCW